MAAGGWSNNTLCKAKNEQTIASRTIALALNPRRSTSQSPRRRPALSSSGCASFYVRASLASSVAISITASTGELCCKEPRFGSHSIRPLGQRTGACLSGSRRIPLGMNTFSPTCGRSSVILTPMENAPLAYFVVIVRLFRYGSLLRCSLEASQS